MTGAGDSVDICVIGAGSGGLVTAYAASHMGRRVVLVEGARMGGDCLNAGCVPSKALLAAGKAAHAMRHSARFGITPVEPAIDFAAVNRHVRDVVATIEPNDSVERYTGFGVDVVTGHARFVSPGAVEVEGRTICARRFVIATGSRAAIPPIPGLDSVPLFTNETLFDNQELPRHLIIIGGGPIGSEMAQAHRRLGSRVTVLDMGPLLPHDDPELAAVVKSGMMEEGIEIIEHVAIRKVSGEAGHISVSCDRNDETLVVEGSHLLVAAGRRPEIADLGLDAAGVAHDRRGIRIDRRLRTTNRRIYAIGDCAGGFQFTHLASYHAGIVIRNALLRIPAKVNLGAFPWVTYTDPELAHVGLTEEAARKRHGTVRVLRFRCAESDRAIAERSTKGLVKVVTTPRGRILGASIVAAHAGELIAPWVLAMGSGLKVGALAGMIAPYPTLGEISKRAAGSFYTPRVFGKGMKRLAGLLARFG